MSTFEIEWSGQDRVTCESLRLAVLAITERNLDVGTAELLHVCDPSADDLMAEGTLVSLYQNDEIVFAGISKLSSMDDGPNGHTRTYTLCDPWQWLRDSCYSRGDFSFESLMNLDNPAGPTMSVCWDYLREYWGEYMTDLFYWPTFEETELPEVWWLTVQGISRQQVASNLSILMRHYTHAGIRWDYSTSPPTMVVTKRSALGDTFTYDRGDWISCRLAPNDLARPQAVAFRAWKPWREYFDSVDLPESQLIMYGDHAKNYQTVIYPASGYPKGGPGTLVYNFKETEYSFVNENGAEWIYNLLTPRLWSGEISLRGIIPLHVGSTINATGLHPDCETMAAVVQSVRRDYFAETTTAQIGPTNAVTGESIIERATAYSRFIRGWDNTVIPGSQIEPPT